MRKTAVVLLSCLALTGCASDWQGEVRLKVDQVEDYRPNPNFPVEKRVWLDLVGDMPKDALDRKEFTGKIVSPADISGGEVKAGDEVVCTAKQHTIGALQTNTIQTDLSGCRKA
ncbi:hypothetical protein Lesp02_36810 [Lentzea sp. NBRC 105346]|uniref:hypothetical protein n=1 Tax=Lentzea sp. NBRC 105346 TaxID=3032205 RepID=UPI0024A28EF3|nr:hypothetical protein [Lentzea sp. NBRC 105346]GLZ31493.1 hypothetical protein Lesp02_36810 [Lentzea sp. NBRC 105346]